MTIGERIKLYRAEANFTQKKLSELTGIHEVTIRQYEANKYSPKMQNIEKIASALNVPINSLLDLKDDSKLLETLSFFPSATFEEEDGKKHITFMNIRELHTYLQLNNKGKKKALSYIEDLSKLPEYTEDEPPTAE